MQFFVFFFFFNGGRTFTKAKVSRSTKVLMQPGVSSPLKIKTTQDPLVNYLVESTKIRTVSIRA